MIARRLFLLGFAVALAAAFGCSSGSDNSGGGTPTPALLCTDGGAAAANGVTLACGGALNSSTEKINVVMGGPSGGPATTLRGLNFDVIYDPANLDFVPASVYTSPLFPNALILVSLENGVPGRVVVSIQQPGSSPNVTVPAGQFGVLALTFARASGMSFTPTPLAFENFEATSASVAIAFTSDLALSYP